MVRIDLHCHLDGSLSKQCVENIVGRPVRMEELQADMECKSLAEYLEKFDLPLEGLQTEQGLFRAGLDFMKSSAKQKLDYVEVRFAPLLSCQGDLNCYEVIESVLRGLEEGKKTYGVEYGVLTCAMRHHTEEENLKMLRCAREFLGAGVCGADLAGNEAAFPMRMFRSLFEQVNRMQMPFTIHAGECGNAENIKESILCGTRRIGHGIAMRGREDVLNLCKEKRIGVEMCPISNMQTKAVSDVRDYPMREFLDKGILVTINTDNRTVSQTTLDKEIEFVKMHAQIKDEDIDKMSQNAVEIAFASDDVKHKLSRLL